MAMRFTESSSRFVRRLSTATLKIIDSARPVGWFRHVSVRRGQTSSP
jgi:hypothetical protein